MSKRVPSKNILPSLSSIIFIAILLNVFFIRNGASLLGDGDTGYHIRAGEYFIQNHHLISQDIFSFHNPPPIWIAHEWLSELVMGYLYLSLGLPGVIFFFAVLLAVISVWFFKMAYAHCNILFALPIALFAVAVTSPGWLARPHIIALLFFMSTCALLREFQTGQKNRLYLLPAAMLFWVNFHGGYIMGFFLIAVYGMGNIFLYLSSIPKNRDPLPLEKAKKLAWVFLACLGASLINPQGVKILLFPFQFMSNKFMIDHIQEFLAPDFHASLPFKYFLLMAVSVFMWSRKQIDGIDFFLILTTLSMSLYSYRHVALFTVVALPVLAGHLEAIWQSLGNHALKEFVGRRIRNLESIESTSSKILWPALLTSALFMAVCFGCFHSDYSRKQMPMDALEFLKKEPITGHVYNEYVYGGLMIYKLWPQYRVFIDGRADMYGEKIFKEYLKVVNLERRWEEVFTKYSIDWVFFPTKSSLSYELSKDIHWKLIYSDKLASIFVKNGSPYQNIINKYPHVELFPDDAKSSSDK